ncbi:MAG: hypothetical protein NTV38_11865 [Chloroflexi bacterium]|jgi:hypothetical protein|nr:hypothetical protein [Chloroflexota bacterium]
MIEYAISIKYMLAGYAVILSVLALYIVSLFIRWRNLKRDLQTLNEIQKKSL